MIRVAILAAVVGSSCAKGMWVSEADGVRVQQNLCDLSRSFDLVGHANLIEIGEPRDMLFELWPQSYLRVTEVVIDVDDSVRGEAGKMRVLISAPERSGKLRTASRLTPIGSGGWVLGTVFAHADGSGKSMYLDASGFAPSGKEQIRFDWFGSYDTASFRSQIEKLPSECARGAPPKR